MNTVNTGNTVVAFNSHCPQVTGCFPGKQPFNGLSVNNYKVLVAANALKKSLFRLRHDVFCEELSWVKEQRDCLEMDDYDDLSEHIAVADASNTVIATLRFTGPQHPWMLEDCFPFTSEEDITGLRRQGFAEVSRMAVKEDIRNLSIADGLSVFDFLLGGALLYADSCAIEKVVVVTTKTIYCHLKRHRWVIQPIGKLVSMPDGCTIGAFSIDITGTLQASRLLDKIARAQRESSISCVA